MEYRELGATGLRVSTFTLGTATFGAVGPLTRFGVHNVAGARRQLDVALDAGVNLLDTADAYSGGACEEAVGKVIAGRRDRVLVATKVRFPMGDGPNDAGLSRHHVIEACEASLRRLHVDHIDLYQLHEWDGRTPLEETLGALDLLVRSGKVRYVGCSNFAGWQVMKALGVARLHGFARLASNQVYLSLLERSAEYDIVPTAVDQGLGLLLWSPLAGGLLSGKFRRGRPEPPGSRHTGGFPEPPVHDREQLYNTVEILVELGEAHAVSPSRVALAWLLGRPGVTSIVVGARNEQQLLDNLAAGELELTPEERSRLERASRPQLVYPYWHQCAHARDRLGPADLSLIGPYLDEEEQILDPPKGFH